MVVTVVLDAFRSGCFVLVMDDVMIELFGLLMCAVSVADVVWVNFLVIYVWGFICLVMISDWVNVLGLVRMDLDDGSSVLFIVSIEVVIGVSIGISVGDWVRTIVVVIDF